MTIIQEGSKKPSHWDVVQEDLHTDCSIYKVYRRLCRHPEDGREGDFFVVKGSDWVQVVPITKEGKVVMIRQYRFGSEALSWEVPGGVLEPGESPEEAAVRELFEETGYIGKDIYRIGQTFPNPALQNNKTYFLVLKDCEYVGPRNLDFFEEIEVCTMTLDEVFSMANDGRINHAITINALYFLKNYLAIG